MFSNVSELPTFHPLANFFADHECRHLRRFPGLSALVLTDLCPIFSLFLPSQFLNFFQYVVLTFAPLPDSGLTWSPSSHDFPFIVFPLFFPSRL